MTDTQPEIPLSRIETQVCTLCLSGAGGECHVPGCAFWCYDAPIGDVLAVLRGAVVPPQPVTACGHPTDHRCLDCATDDELLAAIPPFPGGAR